MKNTYQISELVEILKLFPPEARINSVQSDFVIQFDNSGIASISPYKDVFAHCNEEHRIDLKSINLKSELTTILTKRIDYLDKQIESRANLQAKLNQLKEQ